MQQPDPPVFNREEYGQRLDKVRAQMAQRSLDTLIVSNPAHLNYLTGYDGWSFYVHQCVVISLQLAQPLWVGRAMDVNAAHITTWLDAENIVGYDDDYVQSTSKHPMDFVAKLLAERAIANGRIGVEKDSYYFTGSCLEHLQDGLRGANLVDATSLVAWVRVIKSDAELALMRDAASIIELTMSTAIEQIHVGQRQCDLAATILSTQVAGLSHAGGDYPAIMPMLPSGIGTSTPHLTWSDAPFRDGEATILELAGVRRRYHCPMSRTVHLGTPPVKLADTAKIVIEGLNTAIDKAKPGVRCEQVEAAWRAVIARHGIVKDSRLGYSCGLAYPPDWGEGTLSLRPGDMTELQPGMTIHVMPGIWLDDWGVEISECVQITEQGAQRFCSLAQELTIK